MSGGPKVTGQAFSTLPPGDILDIEEAAAVLRCSVDTLRRVSKRELPVYRGVGKRNLYLREDLIRFIRGRRLTGPDIDQILDDVASSVLGSRLDSVRGRSQTR